MLMLLSQIVREVSIYPEETYDSSDFQSLRVVRGEEEITLSNEEVMRFSSNPFGMSLMISLKFRQLHEAPLS